MAKGIKEVKDWIVKKIDQGEAREGKYKLTAYEEEVLDRFICSKEFHILNKILATAAGDIMKQGFADSQENFMYYKGRLYECQQIPRELERIVERNRRRKAKEQRDKGKEDGKTT